MKFKHSAAAAIIAGLFSATCITPVLAQENPHFSLELNTATETEGGACRLTFVTTNETDNVIDQISYQIGLFNTDAVVVGLLNLNFGSFSAGKTKIKQFDLGGMACGSISSILFSTVASCVVDGTESEDFCQSTQVQFRSRTAIQVGA